MTGVRSRCERSATAARSASRSSPVRSASPLSAAASSSVSAVPVTSARAERSPSRSRCATSATSSSGSLIRRPSWAAITAAASISRTPSPTMPAHASRHPLAQDLGRRARAHHRRALRGDDRQQHPAALVVDGGDRLAVLGALHLGVLDARLRGADTPPSAVKTVTCVDPWALRSSTTSVRVCSSTWPATSAATLPACWSTAAIARSSARVRTSRQSGTTNDTTTADVVSSTSQEIRCRIRGSRGRPGGSRRRGRHGGSAARPRSRRACAAARRRGRRRSARSRRTPAATRRRAAPSW